MGRPRRDEVDVAHHDPGDEAGRRCGDRRVEERPEWISGVAISLANDDEVAGIGNRGTEPGTPPPSTGLAPYAPLSRTPRSARRRRAGAAGRRTFAKEGRSPSMTQPIRPTITTEKFVNTVASPGPDVLDGVLPEQQVEREEDPCDQGDRPVARGAPLMQAGLRSMSSANHGSAYRQRNSGGRGRGGAG